MRNPERKWVAWTTKKIVINPDQAWFIAGPENRYMDRTCGFTEADATLMAAAPELEEACIAFVEACDSAPPTELLKHIGAACEKARAAIAKRKGGAS